MRPQVTVVIPTYRRPNLLERSVRSALSQTVEAIEVVVVVDGEDDGSTAALERIVDRRLRWTILRDRTGAAEARNRGVETATAEWIAFLDDDDEWLPRKLEAQLRVAREVETSAPIVSCRSLVRTPKATYAWPSRLPGPSEHVSDYLFRRRSLFQGEGFVGTPSVLTTKDLLTAIPFRADLPRHQDWDWLLRATGCGHGKLYFVNEPLVIIHREEPRESISVTMDWRASLEWIDEMRSLVSPTAYSAFICTVVASQAAAAGDWAAFISLQQRARQLGQARAWDLLLFAGMWLVPRRVRHWLRASLRGSRHR